MHSLLYFCVLSFFYAFFRLFTANYFLLLFFLSFLYYFFCYSLHSSYFLLLFLLFLKTISSFLLFSLSISFILFYVIRYCLLSFFFRFLLFFFFLFCFVFLLCYFFVSSLQNILFLSFTHFSLIPCKFCFLSFFSLFYFFHSLQIISPYFLSVTHFPPVILCNFFVSLLPSSSPNYCCFWPTNLL